MLTGTLVIEGLGWNVDEVEFPGMDPQTGQPTGETIKRHVITLIPFDIDNRPIGTTIELRLAEEHFENFKRTLSQSKIEVVGADVLKRLPSASPVRGNGGG